MSEEEKKLIDFDNINDLTVLWCIKESIYKIHGDRNLFFKEHIRLESVLNQGNDGLKVRIDHHHYHGVYVLKYEFLENYVLVYTDLDL